MTNTFKYRCTRRVHPQIQTGAGSGGDDDHGQHAHYTAGHYSISAEEVEVIAQTRHPRLTLEAVNDPGAMDGLAFVGIHGDKGVRITTGVDPLVTQTFDSGTDGVEIFAEHLQTIDLKRGVGNPLMQRIWMQPDAILIDGTNAGVTISSAVKITLQVGEGMSFIELTPEGITIQGLMVNINP